MWRLPGCCPAVWLSVSVLGDNVWVSCYLRCSSCARPWPGPGLVPGNTGHWTPRRVRISHSAVWVVASCTTWPRCHEPVAAVASRSVVVAMVCRGWRRAAAAPCRTAPPRAVPMFPGSSPCLHSAPRRMCRPAVMQYRHHAAPPRTPASPPRRCVMCSGGGGDKEGWWLVVAVAAVTQSLSPSHLQSPLQLRAAAQSRAAAKL